MFAWTSLFQANIAKVNHFFSSWLMRHIMSAFFYILNTSSLRPSHVTKKGKICNSLVQ